VVWIWVRAALYLLALVGLGVAAASRHVTGTIALATLFAVWVLTDVIQTELGALRDELKRGR
jgi:hypothetical protein